MQHTDLSFNLQSGVFDFGTITTGAVVEHTYTFTNTGDRPLIIHEVIGSCSGCITTTWSEGPIEPGKQGEIKVRFDSTDHAEEQTKIIVIRANTDPSEFRLLFKGIVNSP